MDLKAVAADTLRILRDGRYVAPSGRAAGRGTSVELGREVRAAVSGTVLYPPGSISPRTSGAEKKSRIEVTDETTSAAGRRLSKSGRVCALNFASARNPGGGFLKGAKAQEEDIARASALYLCLEPHRTYYDTNRSERSAIYTDHVIYSPDVPFFRDDRYDLLDEIALVSIITAPAPNAGALDPSEKSLLAPALERRAGIVLEIAARHGYATLVLGAWGCGVFANDPHEVAQTFQRWLNGAFRGVFEHIVFAIWDRSRERSTLSAFRHIFP